MLNIFLSIIWQPRPLSTHIMKGYLLILLFRWSWTDSTTRKNESTTLDLLCQKLAHWQKVVQQSIFANFLGKKVGKGTM